MNRYHTPYYLTWWLIGCHFLFSCNAVSSSNTTIESEFNRDSIFKLIADGEKLVKSGDIITRTGNDFTSDCLRKLNRRDKTFSHCGIANIENDSVIVYHAIGGDINPNQKIKKDCFSEFVTPYGNRGFGIFRMKLPDTAIQKSISNALVFYRKGISFDMKFDLNSDDKMYCSEFVAKSICNGRIIPFSTIQKISFIGIDDITGMPFMENIFSKKYINQ